MNKKWIPVAMSVLLMQGFDVMAEPSSSRQLNTDVPSCLVISPNDTIPTIEDKVKENVAKHLKIDKNRISLNSDLVRDLGADSLDVVEIVIELEKEFGIEFTDNELNNLKKVGDLVTVVEKRKKGVK